MLLEEAFMDGGHCEEFVSVFALAYGCTFTVWGTDGHHSNRIVSPKEESRSAFSEDLKV